MDCAWEKQGEMCSVSRAHQKIFRHWQELGSSAQKLCLWVEEPPQLLAKVRNKIQDSRQQSLLVKHQAALWKILLLLENRDSKRQLPQRLMHKSINENIQPDSFILNNRSFYISPKLVLPTSCFALITTHKQFTYTKYQLVPNTGTRVPGCNLGGVIFSGFHWNLVNWTRA